MNIEKICSRDNKRLKVINKLLESSRYRNETGLFVLEGLRLCTDAVNTGMEIDELYYTETALNKNNNEITTLQNHSVKIFETTENIFGKISDTVSPQGILCVLKQRSKAFDLIKNGRYLCLEDLNDPANLGAVSRTAEALGTDGIILTDKSCDVNNPKALRASMGSLLRLPVMIVNDISEVFNLAGQAGLTTFASVPDRTAEPIFKCDFSNGGIMFIGNEANGLKPETIKCCNKKITIPMGGRAESLNAAAAAAILIYEMMK